MLSRNFGASADGNGLAAGTRAAMPGGLWAVPVLAAVLTALLAGGCGRPELLCGNTVVMGDQDTVLLAMVKREHGVFAERLRDVEVGFYAGDQQLARTRTDDRGFAVAVGRLPAGARSLEARASVDGHAMASQGQVLVWEPGRPIVVCDIDGTISDTDYQTLVFKQEDRGSEPLPDAAETLQKLSKQYNILFITARPVFLRDKTRQWLQQHGFPLSPVIYTPELRDMRMVEQYKQRVISRLMQLYPDLLIGIGNAETDSQAYTSDGMLAVMIDDGENRRFRSEAIALRTWKRVAQFFEVNQDVLSSPSRLRTLLSEGGLVLYPQQPIGVNEKPRETGGGR